MPRKPNSTFISVTCLFAILMWNTWSSCPEVSRESTAPVPPSRVVEIDVSQNFVNRSWMIPESVEEYFAGGEDLMRRYFTKSLSYAGTLDALRSALLEGVTRGKLRIGIGGGSVSVGGNCHDDTQRRWFTTLKNALERGFALRSVALDVQIINAAQGATGPSRLAYCLDELLPESVDIMIFEYAINEGGGMWSEVLLRQFQPAKTALFFLETFSMKGPIGQGFDSSQQYHDTLARYYDIPLLSARDAFRDEFIRHPDAAQRWFADDHHHPSCLGHATLGLLAAELVFHTFESVGHHQPIAEAANYTHLTPLYIRPKGSFPISLHPTCLLAAHGLLAKQKSTWPRPTGPKPSFDCTGPEDGDLSIPVSCRPSGKDRCQVILSYTRSWRPMGVASIYFNTSRTPDFSIDAFAADWVERKTYWTVQQYTDSDEDRLKIPMGDTLVRIRCDGSSTAPAEHAVADSPFSRFTFQVHALVLL